jgi:paraquat-inducible protein A
MAASPRSLREFRPDRPIVPWLIAGSSLLLAAGLSLPLMTVEKSILWRHWKNTYSVATGIVNLAQEGDWLLAVIIFFFSIVFPITKLTALWVIWAIRLEEQSRAALLHWLSLLGKWSMLDVFVVAITIVAAKMESISVVRPQVGLYVFAASIVASMLTTQYVERLARRTLRRPPPA